MYIRNKGKYYLIVLLLIPFSVILSQGIKADSLLLQLKSCKHDTDKIKILLKLGAHYRYSNQDTAILLFKQSRDLAYKVNYGIFLPEALRQLAWMYYLKCDYPKSMLLYAEALSFVDNKLSSDFDKKSGLLNLKGNLIGNMGVVYLDQSNNKMALDCFFKALSICEQLNKPDGIALHLGNIALVYQLEQDHNRALIYNFKALKIKQKLNDKNEIANTLGNIGSVYHDLKKVNLAKYYFLRAQTIFIEVGNINAHGLVLTNIGILFREQKKYKEALEYFNNALSLVKQAQNKDAEALVLSNIASCFDKLNEFKKSDKTFIAAIDLAKELGKLVYLKDFYGLYSDMLNHHGESKKAFETYKEFVFYRDSLNNSDTKREIAQKEMQYEFEKKLTADSLRVANESKVNSIKLKHEKTQRYYLYGGLLLTIGFTIFLFTRLKTTQSQKKLIESQKKELENQKVILDKKQKEILDSINYAKRIQVAHLPTNKYLSLKLRVLLVFLPLFTISQNHPKDSIIKELAKLKNEQGYRSDTLRYNLNILLVNFLKRTNPDTCLTILSKQDSIFSLYSDTPRIANINTNLCRFYYRFGKYVESIHYGIKAKNYITTYSKRSKSTNEILLTTFYNLSITFGEVGNYSQALDYAFMVLKERELQSNKRQLVIVLNAIGTIYKKQKQYDLALKYYKRALSTNLKDKQIELTQLINIGNIYNEINHFKRADSNYRKAMNLAIKENSRLELNALYENFASLFLKENNYDSALHYSNLGLKLSNEIGDIYGLSSNNNIMAEIALAKRKPVEAIQFAENSLKFLKKNPTKNLLKEAYKILSKAFELKRDYTNALKYYKLEILIRDSLHSELNQKALVIKEMQYEFDKKLTADSLKINEEKKVVNYKLQAEKTQRYFLYLGLLLVFAFAILIFNRFKLIQKQKKLIEQQKQEVERQKFLVEEKQKEILGSINYAKRIQQALLPNYNYLSKKIKS